MLPFLRDITFPLVISNVDSSAEPQMAGIHVTDHVIDVNGERVGIVGFTSVSATNFKKVGRYIQIVYRNAQGAVIHDQNMLAS